MQTGRDIERRAERRRQTGRDIETGRQTARDIEIQSDRQAEI